MPKYAAPLGARDLIYLNKKGYFHIMSVFRGGDPGRGEAFKRESR